MCIVVCNNSKKKRQQRRRRRDVKETCRVLEMELHKREGGASIKNVGADIGPVSIAAWPRSSSEPTPILTRLSSGIRINSIPFECSPPSPYTYFSPQAPHSKSHVSNCTCYRTRCRLAWSQGSSSRGAYHLASTPGASPGCCHVDRSLWQ